MQNSIWVNIKSLKQTFSKFVGQFDLEGHFQGDKFLRAV